MSRPIRLEPEAEEELHQAARWYEGQRAGLGTKFVSAVASAFDAIAQKPTIGAPIPGLRPGAPARRVLMRRFPYAVVFLETGETIRILAVAHRRRLPGYWMERVRR